MTEEIVKMANVAKETIDVLSYFEASVLTKIPGNFMQSLKEMVSLSTISVNVDRTKDLEEQKISEDCKDMIALIYYSYIANDEEKEEISQKWRENEQQYNTDNLFKNKNNKSETECMQLVENREESIWRKILNKIKRLFKK